MSIFVIGINHKTASLAIREKVYFAVDKLTLYLQDLPSQNFASEAVLISTCNRTELYCIANDPHVLFNWFANQTTLSRAELEKIIYVYADEQAVIHMTEVACGLDSMILGEAQILGQLKEAFSESCEAKAVGAIFHRLFQHIFSIAKEIRTVTAIGACPVSVASAALHFAKKQFAQLQTSAFNEANIAIIGLGETGTLLFRYLNTQIENPLHLVNRNKEKAKTYSEKAYHLKDLTRVLSQVDLVFSATGSAMPLIDERMMNEVMLLRNHKPLLLIDMAVPRDIDEEVKKISHVHLYCIDDLKSIIETNRQGREHAAIKAREMIIEKSRLFMHEIQSLDVVSEVICAYRQQIETLCQIELSKAKEQLTQGRDPEEILEMFANAFINKLMHEPSVQLRQAGVEGRFEILKLVKQLFAIADPKVERL